jgi:hypothetical protein
MQADDAANVKLAIWLLGQRQDHVHALHATEFVEDRLRAVTQTCTALLLFEGLPQHVGEEAHQDVGLYPIGALVSDGADWQIGLVMRKAASVSLS